MNKPKHQHFVPKSYLKNFAKRGTKDKKFVEAMEVTTNQFNIFSIKDICVRKGLYTDIRREDPYYLEKYYASNVDDLYQEVYEMLVDKSLTRISVKNKKKIIYTISSLYFRTPKFLNALNYITDQSIDKAISLVDTKMDDIEIDFHGFKLKFKRAEIEIIKKKLHEKNRYDFIDVHIDEWHKFVEYKLNCEIAVFEVNNEIELITSDNPVIITNSSSNKFHLFSPDNLVEVPLDRTHFLIIYPNSVSENSNNILRGKRDKYFALANNLKIHKFAEMWILGYPESCKNHVITQKKYGEYNEENLRNFYLIKEKSEQLNELVEIMQNFGALSPEVKDKIIKMKQLNCFNENYDLDEIIKSLEVIGVKFK